MCYIAHVKAVAFRLLNFNKCIVIDVTVNIYIMLCSLRQINFLLLLFFFFFFFFFCERRWNMAWERQRETHEKCDGTHYSLASNSSLHSHNCNVARNKYFEIVVIKNENSDQTLTVILITVTLHITVNLTLNMRRNQARITVGVGHRHCTTVQALRLSPVAVYAILYCLFL